MDKEKFNIMGFVRSFAHATAEGFLFAVNIHKDNLKFFLCFIIFSKEKRFETSHNRNNSHPWNIVRKAEGVNRWGLS